ncbi:MAG: AMP-binding protein [Epsilonproteobacteria bacterium]|nr:AMP-binding protein [Campylobacterota bacterium]
MTVNTIRNLLERAADYYPQKTALIEKKEKVSYKELLKRVNKIAKFLNTLPLKKGDRIGIYSNKCINQVISILSVLSTDFVIVPITRFYKPDQLKHIIKDCDIKCIITDKTKIKNVKEVNFEGKIISFEPIEKEIVSFEEILKCYDDNYACDVKSHANAVITYSYATHSFAKGIVISHRNLTDGARIVSKYLDIKKEDVISGVLSFNLDYGLNQIFCALYNKATLAIHKYMLASDFFNHLINDKVTILPVMPIHISQMFDEDPHKIPRGEFLKNIRAVTSSGGNLTAKMIKDIQTHFPNAKFYSMHGLTEAFRSTYLDPSQINIRPNSIGKAVPDVEIYVINENKEECKPREVGELIHRGACIYKGYWNAPEETAKRFKSIKILEKVLDLEGDLIDETVVASGDYVYKDEEGYLYFVSRKDDMIKTRGYRVSPYEIESVVYDNISEIKQCAVFGVENEKIEEEIVLVYSAQKPIPKNSILFELKKHLPTYMLPSIIVYKEYIPLQYGKMDKEKLKKEVLKTL